LQTDGLSKHTFILLAIITAFLSVFASFIPKSKPLLPNNEPMLPKSKPILANNEPMLGINGAMLANNEPMLGRNSSNI